MITLFFDTSSKTPLYEQLYQYIKQAIEQNELKANEKLPSKRKLAAHLKVSVITIETAYNQLMVEGYIKSKPKSGFFVMPYVRLKPTTKSSQTNHVVTTVEKPHYEVDFKTNQVDQDSFPYSKFAKIERDIVLDNYKTNINNTNFLGLYDLRVRISEFLFEYRGIETSPELIVVGSGSEYLISLLILLLGRDKIYGVEEPGYIKNYRLYLDYGAQAKAISLDDQGIRMNSIGNTDILHTTPSHQFPKGIVTTISRRMELLNWAYEQDDRYLIEDDYDSEFRFTGNPIPAMKGMDPLDRVIYMNSFSKSIAPSLRVSFMVLPKKLMQNYVDSYSYFTCSVPMITQMVLENFMREKEYERHLNRMKILYKSKRDTLIDLFQASSFGNKIDIIGEEAGLHFLVRFKTDASVLDIVERAKAVGVRVYGIYEYCLSERKKLAEKLIILGYSHLQNANFVKATKLLEKAWENLL